MPRRETRRFGPGPYIHGLRWRLAPGEGFPFDVPAVEQSTIVEAIAEAVGFAPEGGELERAGELPAVPRPVLEGTLEPVLTRTRPRTGYFLRAESFFNIARLIDGGSEFAPDLSLYGDVPLHEQSHGQSFLSLASNRFGGHGLFVLDEPEAALSVTGALALLDVVVRGARAGAQFVIATHSPILLACPGARLYELTDAGIAETAYDDADTVRLMRGFLDAPERYLRAMLDA
jgi:predicted ATPase